MRCGVQDMFIERVNALMEERGINKHELSVGSGIPYTTIDGWFKKGSDNVRLGTLLRLAEYFNVSLDYLTGGEGGSPAEQLIIASTMQSRYIDRYVLPDLGIKAGTVQLIFNSPDPDAQLKKAQLIQTVATLDPTDPEFLLSVEEMAEIWGKHPAPGEYDSAKLKDEILDGMMHHIAEALGNNGHVIPSDNDAEGSDPKEGAQ